MKGDQESDAATAIRRIVRGARIAAACQFAWEARREAMVSALHTHARGPFSRFAVHFAAKKYGACLYRTAVKPNSQQLTQYERR